MSSLTCIPSNWIKPIVIGLYQITESFSAKLDDYLIPQGHNRDPFRCKKGPFQTKQTPVKRISFTPIRITIVTKRILFILIEVWSTLKSNPLIARCKWRRILTLKVIQSRRILLLEELKVKCAGYWYTSNHIKWLIFGFLSILFSSLAPLHH